MLSDILLPALVLLVESHAFLQPEGYCTSDRDFGPIPDPESMMGYWHEIYSTPTSGPRDRCGRIKISAPTKEEIDENIENCYEGSEKEIVLHTIPFVKMESGCERLKDFSGNTSLIIYGDSAIKYGNRDCDYDKKANLYSFRLIDKDFFMIATCVITPIASLFSRQDIGSQMENYDLKSVEDLIELPSLLSNKNPKREEHESDKYCLEDKISNAVTDPGYLIGTWNILYSYNLNSNEKWCENITFKIPESDNQEEHFYCETDSNDSINPFIMTNTTCERPITFKSGMILQPRDKLVFYSNTKLKYMKPVCYVDKSEPYSFKIVNDDFLLLSRCTNKLVSVLLSKKYKTSDNDLNIKIMSTEDLIDIANKISRRRNANKDVSAFSNAYSVPNAAARPTEFYLLYMWLLFKFF